MADNPDDRDKPEGTSGDGSNGETTEPSPGIAGRDPSKKGITGRDPGSDDGPGIKGRDPVRRSGSSFQARTRAKSGNKPARKGMSPKSQAVAAGVVATLVGGGLYAGYNAISNNNSGNNASDDRRCVNDQNVVVEDSECSSGGGGHYYYGGFGGFLPGSVASGGSATSSNNNSTVQRGGFGSNDSNASGSSAGS